ncbi:MAG: cytidine deaminase [Bacteroidales bacterium]
MKQEQIKINYKIFNLSELSDKDRELIKQAAFATHKSYSPYSNFKVGAAVQLDDGEILLGSNQENIAYPSGLCAERTALFSAGTKQGNVIAIAISAKDEKGNLATAYPCGACRQVMIETQKQRTKHPIKILIHRKDNTVLQIDDVNDLLPFSFEY